ncbi:unnamed protein product [Cochlearia groenlandica]
MICLLSASIGVSFELQKSEPPKKKNQLAVDSPEEKIRRRLRAGHSGDFEQGRDGDFEPRRRPRAGTRRRRKGGGAFIA